MDWVEENIEKGVSGKKILAVLRNKGFHPTRNKELMELLTAFDSLNIRQPVASTNVEVAKKAAKAEAEQGSSRMPLRSPMASASTPHLPPLGRSALPTEQPPPTLRPAFYHPQRDPTGRMIPVSPLQGSRDNAHLPRLKYSGTMVEGVPGRGKADTALGMSLRSPMDDMNQQRREGKMNVTTLRGALPRRVELEQEVSKSGFALTNMNSLLSDGSRSTHFPAATGAVTAENILSLSTIPIADSKRIPPVWTAWIRDNLGRGVKGRTIMLILEKHGFNPRMNPTLVQALTQSDRGPLALKRAEIRKAVAKEAEKKIALQRAKEERRKARRDAMEYARSQGLLAGFEEVGSSSGSEDEDDPKADDQPKFLSYRDKVLAKALANAGLGGEDFPDDGGPNSKGQRDLGLADEDPEGGGTFWGAIKRGDAREVERYLAGGIVSGH